MEKTSFQEVSGEQEELNSSADRNNRNKYELDNDLAQLGQPQKN